MKCRNAWFLLAGIFISNNVFSLDASFAFGLGHVYGGVLGGQVQLADDKHKYRMHLGMAGVGVGYDYQLARKHTIGTTLGVHYPFGRLLSIDWTYYVNGVSEKGLHLGLSMVRSQPVSLSAASKVPGYDSTNDRSLPYETYPWFSIGYRF